MSFSRNLTADCPVHFHPTPKIFTVQFHDRAIRPSARRNALDLFLSAVRVSKHETARPYARPVGPPIQPLPFGKHGPRPNRTLSELRGHERGRAPRSRLSLVVVLLQAPPRGQTVSTVMTGKESFESTLAKLSSVLKERGVSYALIGGLAVAAWGTPRATEDIV